MTVKPTITGLDVNIPIDLGKRLEWIGGRIVFECPECGHKMEQLDDTADLEYGSFHGFDECCECGADFEHQYFEVEAFVKIKIKGE